jgi:uncharacterized membrane protein
MRRNHENIQDKNQEVHHHRSLSVGVVRILAQPGNLPKIVGSINSIEVRDGKRSHCTMLGPGGHRLAWDAEIMKRCSEGGLKEGLVVMH